MRHFFGAGFCVGVEAGAGAGAGAFEDDAGGGVSFEFLTGAAGAVSFGAASAGAVSVGTLSFATRSITDSVCGILFAFLAITRQFKTKIPIKTAVVRVNTLA
jgi:hypothetical protein